MVLRHRDGCFIEKKRTPEKEELSRKEPHWNATKLDRSPCSSQATVICFWKTYELDNPLLFLSPDFPPTHTREVSQIEQMECRKKPKLFPTYSVGYQ